MFRERFWAKVDKRGSDECWTWIGSKRNGYGEIWSRDRHLYAHRMSWKLHYGLIPKGVSVLHHCDNRACVNPKHLFLGTQADNMTDMVGKGRQSKGEERPTAKLTQEQVLAIRNDPRSERTLGRIYGVCHASIGRVKRRKRWTWLKEAT